MPRNSVLLDPFCGSGTIVYEGARFGLKTVGVDANPVAVLLSKGKMTKPTEYSEVKEEIDNLILNTKKISDFKKLPKYASKIFHTDSLQEIFKASTLINKMSDYVKAICLTARGCNHYKWTSSTVGKNIEPKRYISFYEKWRTNYFCCRR